VKLDALSAQCRRVVRKAREIDTEAWLLAGLPKGHGLPAPAAMAAQMVDLKEALTGLLRAQRDRYVAYILSHPPALAPIAKGAAKDLPPETVLTHHFWLEGVTVRREWWNQETQSFQVDTRELASALGDSLEEAVGTGGMAARTATGALPPGFAGVTQPQAQALAREIAAWKTSRNAAARAIYQAIADRAGSAGLRGAALRDGAGRLVAAVSYRIGASALDVVHLGALETEVPGTGVQLVRELAAVAARNGKGIALQAPAEAGAFFEGLGFAAETEGRFSLAAQAASGLAQSPSVLGPAWSRVGWLQGPEVSIAPVDLPSVPAVLRDVSGWTGTRRDLAEVALSSVEFTGTTVPVLVAKGADGTVLAVAQYRLAGENLVVTCLSVNPASPVGGGIGRRVMGEIASIARQGGLGVVIDQPTKGAIGFYERLGMQWSGGSLTFTAEEASAFASGLTGGSAFGGQISWDLAVAGAADWLRARKIRGVVDQVTTATHQALVETLADGLEKGQSVQQLAERVRHLDRAFGSARAERIARTEVITASRAGAYYLGADAGCSEHEWRSRKDSRVRAWHLAASGQRVPYDEPFTVDNAKGTSEKLLYPGDTSLGASASNVILCRCSDRKIKPGVTDDPALGIDEHGLADVKRAPGLVVAGI